MQSNAFEMLYASSSDGLYFPDSMAIIDCLETPTCFAKSSCVIFLALRRSLIRFLNVNLPPITFVKLALQSVISEVYFTFYIMSRGLYIFVIRSIKSNMGLIFEEKEDSFSQKRNIS